MHIKTPIEKMIVNFIAWLVFDNGVMAPYSIAWEIRVALNV